MFLFSLKTYEIVFDFVQNCAVVNIISIDDDRDFWLSKGKLVSRARVCVYIHAQTHIESTAPLSAE